MQKETVGKVGCVLFLHTRLSVYHHQLHAALFAAATIYTIYGIGYYVYIYSPPPPKVNQSSLCYFLMDDTSSTDSIHRDLNSTSARTFYSVGRAINCWMQFFSSAIYLDLLIRDLGGGYLSASCCHWFTSAASRGSETTHPSPGGLFNRGMIRVVIGAGEGGGLIVFFRKSP